MACHLSEYGGDVPALLTGQLGQGGLLTFMLQELLVSFVEFILGLSKIALDL